MGPKSSENRRIPGWPKVGVCGDLLKAQAYLCLFFVVTKRRDRAGGLAVYSDAGDWGVPLKSSDESGKPPRFPCTRMRGTRQSTTNPSPRAVQKRALHEYLYNGHSGTNFWNWIFSLDPGGHCQDPSI